MDTNMESLEEKLSKLNICLHDIKALNTDIPVDKRGVLRRLLSQSLAELGDVKDFLLESVRDQFSPRQLAILAGDDAQTEEEDRELGEIEWNSVFGRCFNIGINIRIYRQKLEVDLVDSITLAIIMSDIKKVETELEEYTTAVLSGKVAGGQLTGSVSCLGHAECQTAGGRSVKYKKNKTENLARKLSTSVFGTNRRGSGTNRKSSLIKLSASMLKLTVSKDDVS